MNYLKLHQCINTNDKLGPLLILRIRKPSQDYYVVDVYSYKYKKKNWFYASSIFSKYWDHMMNSFMDQRNHIYPNTAPYVTLKEVTLKEVYDYEAIQIQI